ncbi:hypothetical protein T08_250 [Trichinella sp. T8]|nr:hypothetical protein T08_250 [Trichinella sp. T8]
MEAFNDVQHTPGDIFVRSIEHRKFEKYIAGFLGCGIPHFTKTRTSMKNENNNTGEQQLLERKIGKIKFFCKRETFSKNITTEMIK